jgi:transposase
MPAPYSYDLRTAAIKAVKRGERKIDVCRLLRISRNTLDLWLKREEKTGNYSAIVNSHKGRKTKITDEEKFRKFVREHSDKTQKRMAEIWGENLTQQNISYFCQKLGITRKKKLTAIKKEMKKNEPNLDKN